MEAWGGVPCFFDLPEIYSSHVILRDYKYIYLQTYTFHASTLCMAKYINSKETDVIYMDLPFKVWHLLIATAPFNPLSE